MLLSAGSCWPSPAAGQEFKDLREVCLMAAQLEKGLKAVGLVIRTVRDPYPYFRVVSRGREIFLLPHHFLILITYWIFFFFLLMCHLAKGYLAAF